MRNQIRIINVIGYSGSGKTHFILDSIRLLESELNLKVGVIKNIHKHQIDKEGKDSYLYSDSGALYSITKNIYNETTVFLKSEVKIEELIDWLEKGPFKIDLIFTEGFRDLIHPTVLCVKDWGEVDTQTSECTKLISGIITKEKYHEAVHIGIPVIDINRDFKQFCSIFELM